MKDAGHRIAVALTVVGAILGIAFYATCLSVYELDDGMAPAVRLGDHVWARLTHTAKFGDVVVYSAPDGKMYLGRVAGTAGDVVEIRDDALFVNGTQRDSLGGTFPPTRVATDHVFVLCDRRSVSTDSRTFGTIANENIRGRAFLEFSYLHGLRRIK